MDLFIDTYFTVSRQKGRSGDIAIIKKKAHDEGAWGCCVALCTPVDTHVPLCLLLCVVLTLAGQYSRRLAPSGHQP